MIYGDDGVYGDYSVYESLFYTATWIQSYEFTYLAGVTVYITAVLDADIPVGSSVQLYAGETIDEYELILDGVQSAVTFESTTSGLTNLYIKIVMNTWMQDSPTIRSINIDVAQETSLYTLAQTVLVSGTAGSNIGYEIDPFLRSVLIPYAWFRPVRHRYALQQITEAVGGVTFCDRYGRIRIEAANYLKRTAPSVSIKTIGQDSIYDSTTPVSDIRNQVYITTQPWTIDIEQDVWDLGYNETIQTGESKTFEVFFNDFEAVLDAAVVATSSPAVTVSQTWYDWGGRVTITGTATDQTYTFKVIGKPLVIVGSRILSASDTDSIRRNGTRELIIDENRFIQSAGIAQIIADEIVEITGSERRDLQIIWRGDPTIELGDKLTVDGVIGYNVGQSIRFDGILTSDMRVRKT